VAFLPLILQKGFTLLFILFTVFFLKFTSESGTFMDSVMQYANMLIFAAAFYYLAEKQLVSGPKVSAQASITLAAFVVVCVLSTILNDYPTYMVAKALYTSLWRVVIAFLIMYLLTNEKRVGLFVSAYVVMATVSLSVMGTVQILIGERIIKAGEGHHNYFTIESSRLSGFVDTDPLSVASALMFLLIICLAYVLVKPSKLYLLAFMLNALGLVLTFSRSAYALFPLAITPLMVVAAKNSRTLRIRRLLWLGGLSVATCAVCAGVMRLPSPGMDLMDLSPSLETRRTLWTQARAIPFKYLLGHSPVVTGSSENFRAVGYECSFESMYIEWFYQTGLLGAVFLGYFVLGAFRNYFRAYKRFSRAGAVGYQMYSLSFCVAFASFLMHGVVFNSSVFSFYAWLSWSMSFVFCRLSERYKIPKDVFSYRCSATNKATRHSGNRSRLWVEVAQ